MGINSNTNFTTKKVTLIIRYKLIEMNGFICALWFSKRQKQLNAVNVLVAHIHFYVNHGGLSEYQQIKNGRSNI
jgi:hypothetical protein